MPAPPLSSMLFKSIFRRGNKPPPPIVNPGEPDPNTIRRRSLQVKRDDRFDIHRLSLDDRSPTNEIESGSWHNAVVDSHRVSLDETSENAKPKARPLISIEKRVTSAEDLLSSLALPEPVLEEEEASELLTSYPLEAEEPAVRKSVHLVIPSKALAFDNSGVSRATSEGALQQVLGEDYENFDFRGTSAGGFALPRRSDDSVQVHESEAFIVAFFGKLENPEYFTKKYSEKLVDGSANDAAIVSVLYEERKYKFLSALRGKFSFILYDKKGKWCFAASEKSGSFPLYQGVDSTGGLLVSNVPGTIEEARTEIQPASFICGQYRDRHLHKYESTEVEYADKVANSVAAAQHALRNLPRRVVPSSPTPVSVDTVTRTPAVASVTTPQAPVTLEVISMTPVPAGTTSKAVTTTPSSKGTADRVNTWKSSREQRSQFRAVADTVRPYKNRTTNSSGQADHAGSWKKKSVGDVMLV